jgi:hypothetical protein
MERGAGLGRLALVSAGGFVIARRLGMRRRGDLVEIPFAAVRTVASWHFAAFAALQHFGRFRGEAGRLQNWERGNHPIHKASKGERCVVAAETITGCTRVTLECDSKPQEHAATGRL